jgi:DNA repair protein RecN (Recombination protein N)
MEVRAYLEKSRVELSDLEHREERLAALEEEIGKTAQAYASSASDLHVKRVKTGSRLAEMVKGLLGDLGLPDARMDVWVEPQTDPESPVMEKKEYRALSAVGWDRVEFQFSANPGEPLRPLVKVASGGESSRVMLALKAVLSDSDEVGTLVFDEIDTGVGARTAPAVGKVMERLAAEKQVLCISHLAPLAVLGKVHYRVRKEIRGGKTFTLVEK